ncbi:hypothetical protein KFK09_000249 [Dendrobium nobile]|uniref:Uncharacterized protein n=1 Tax=Dendrobium nobile TaxID=94219 RepID=A0A8T3C8C6_DENNO|nr:hypothetical protein KFK09_000249 [Dendrobium nobile]
MGRARVEETTEKSKSVGTAIRNCDGISRDGTNMEREVEASVRASQWASAHTSDVEAKELRPCGKLDDVR